VASGAFPCDGDGGKRPAGSDGQARLARLVRQPATDVIDLGRVDATNVGRLLAASGTSDIADAHVVICARRTGQQVVTSDPGDLRLLDPAVRLLADAP
jgi:predicted nucleic acid-binding protein